MTWFDLAVRIIIHPLWCAQRRSVKLTKYDTKVSFCYHNVLTNHRSFHKFARQIRKHTHKATTIVSLLRLLLLILLYKFILCVLLLSLCKKKGYYFNPWARSLLLDYKSIIFIPIGKPTCALVCISDSILTCTWNTFAASARLVFPQNPLTPVMPSIPEACWRQTTHWIQCIFRCNCDQELWR